MTEERLVVVGAGAAGLMAAIQAGRAQAALAPLLLDGAATLGRKILISGGGRCNVTHDVVQAADFCGATPPAIRKVLRHLTADQARAFFEEIGVPLALEAETGKLFPEANRARVVLEALLRAAEQAGAQVRHPWRVERIRRENEGFVLEGDAGRIQTRRVLIATGGRSVPGTGSDGHGFRLARALGHSLTPKILPALAPLCLPEGHPLTRATGWSQDVCLHLHDGRGRRRETVRGAMLLTHFGLSGPAVLDMSRHWLHLREEDPDAVLRVQWFPDESEDDLDRWLRAAAAERLLPHLATRLPKRLAAVLLELAGIDGDLRGAQLPKDGRRRLLATLAGLALTALDARSWDHAEATAGGVPLTEIHLERMESRLVPGLFFAGEVLDVDGRIGGFNFHWAWVSGLLAGRAAAS